MLLLQQLCILVVSSLQGSPQIILLSFYENKGGNFRRIRAKNFSRHLAAGYACGIDFSNDGQFLMTGD